MDDNSGMPGSGDPAGGQDMCSFFSSVFAHRQSMERLIDWLRFSQTTCTDSNCFDEAAGLPGNEQGSSMNEQPTGDAFNLVMLFLVGILTFYALSIGRDRRLAEGKSAQGGGSNDFQRRFRRDPDGQDHDGRPIL